MELAGTLGCDLARPSGAAMRLKALCELSRRLASFSQVEALLPYVTQKACELCRAEDCAVWLFDHEHEELYHRSHGQSGSALSRSAAKPVIAGQALGLRTGTGVYEVTLTGGMLIGAPRIHPFRKQRRQPRRDGRSAPRRRHRTGSARGEGGRISPALPSG